MLFTTETFAMGLNMPARTVVFSTLKKFDGQVERWAGRRGGGVLAVQGALLRQRLCPTLFLISVLDQFAHIVL